MEMNDLADAYQRVLERITEAAIRSGRDPSAITLVAVTKTYPAGTILNAYELGMRHFGENRIEELAEKRAIIEQSLGPANDITWHLIGPLQSRKAPLAASHADLFQALDRPKIAQRLARQLQGSGRVLPTLLEINISGEDSKAGLPCHQWETNPQQQTNLLQIVTTLLTLPQLQLHGLMTIAPWHVPIGEVRAVFRRTRNLLQWLQGQFPQINWSTLSMGMTDDFELAIEEGATHVRIGRAIFGQRM